MSRLLNSERPAGDISLSAVICTRNRPQQLERALKSLCGQTQPPDAVVVIDNASDDESTRQVAERFHEQVRYVIEPVEGLDAARNRALAECRTDVVAFLDDDAVADVNWAKELRDAFQRNPAVTVCTGRVEALSLETESQRLFEANGGFSRGLQCIRLPQDQQRRLQGVWAPLIAWAVSAGNGASFAVRREAMQAIGGFDEALDLGEALPGGGDLDTFWRLLQHGGEMLYAPQAVAWHEHRRDMESLARQLAGHQKALVVFLCKSAAAAQKGRLQILGFLVWRLVKPVVRILERMLGLDPLPLRILVQMAKAVWSGLFAYPDAKRTAAKRRDPLSRKCVPAMAQEG